MAGRRGFNTRALISLLVASERITLRPENHLNWLKFGQMFDAAGDPEAAERVREIAAQYRP